jgi:LacI family transcriptional regulator
LITIYDIAREARVSPATVSRVLSGSAKVRAEKKTVIQEIINKHGFKPNAIAQSLIAGQTRIIGMLVSDIRNPFYAAVSVECEKAALNNGYRVMLRNAFNDNAVEDESLDMFAELRVDAIIQIGCRVDELVSDLAYVEHVNKIARRIPFVTTGRLDGGNVYSYGVNSEECTDIVFDHLRDLGHTRIAILGGRLNVRSTYEKWTRYIYLHGKYGLPVRQGYVQKGGYSVTEGFECMKKILELDERPTAIIVINDFTTIGALAAIRDAGLSVPEDFSIVSHDNTFLAEMSNPRLTSVDYGYERLGRGLVDTAINLINGKELPRVTFSSPTLSVKASCAVIRD